MVRGQSVVGKGPLTRSASRRGQLGLFEEMAQPGAGAMLTPLATPGGKGGKRQRLDVEEGEAEADLIKPVLI